MRRNVLTLAGIFVSCLAYASQGTTLAVRVRDPQRAPVPDARVTVYSPSGQPIATATARDGSCLLRGLAPGEHLVIVEAAGFSRFGPRRVGIEPGGSRDLDVDLVLGGFREEMVVTATDNAQAAGEVAKSLTLVDRREMDARGDVALADVLRSVPGLRVQQMGAAGSATSVVTRGMRPHDTAVLIDGVRFRDPSGPQGDASDFLGDLVVVDLDRVEILRGPGSSLYGSHAISGVVNLLSADGSGSPEGHLLLEGGSLGLFHGRAHVSGGAWGDRLTGSLGLSRLTRPDGLDPHDAADNTSLQSRVRLRVSSNALLVARFYASEAAAALNETPTTIGRIPGGVPSAVALSRGELERYQDGAPEDELRLDGTNFIPAADDPDSRRESSFRSLLLRFEQRPTTRLGYSVSYQRLGTKRVFFEGPLGVSAFEPAALTRSHYRGTTDTLTTRADLSLGRNHVTAGYEFEREDFADRFSMDTLSADSAADVTQESHAFFVQGQTRRLRDRLQLAVSGRVQQFVLRAPRFAPAEAAPYQGIAFGDPPAAHTLDGSVAYAWPSRGTRWRAHLGTGYRAPSLFERFGSGYWTFGYSAYGDPHLGPERSLGIDAAVDQTLASGKLGLSAGYFRTRLEDAILFDFSGAIDPGSDPFGRSAGYRSVGTGLASGVELTAIATPSASTRLSAAYTFVDAPSPTGVTDAPRALGVPRHQLSFVAFAGLGRPLTASVQVVAMSELLHRVGSRVLRFEGPMKADAQLSYRLPLGARRPVRLRVRVENLLDRTDYESGFRTPGRTLTAGASLGL